MRVKCRYTQSVKYTVHMHVCGVECGLLAVEYSNMIGMIIMCGRTDDIHFEYDWVDECA